MKRLLLLLLLPTITFTWQYYSFIEQRYYTLPYSEKINEEEYHQLSAITVIISRELANSGLCRTKIMKLVEKYLLKLNTNESLRLLDDLKEMVK